MRGQSSQTWLSHLLDPDNPFIPWIAIGFLVLLGAHLVAVYWVHRAALARYNRGAPWALLTMLFPLAGWLFYLMYRVSPLVQLDRMDAELFDEADHQWTDYDRHKLSVSKQLFTELSSVIRKPEGSGYSAWQRMARLREQRRKLTPVERVEAKQIRRQRLLKRRKQRALKRGEVKEQRREKKLALLRRRTITGLHGAKQRMSLGRQKRIKKRLEVAEKLKSLPREDQLLEDLIYEGDYQTALQAARDSLEIAGEVHDKQGIVTYETYVNRLMRLLEGD